ncbi:Os04g0470851 [Oryza sativa Japonica Group]|uniref:Os04g0470851 protein n=1 Tax=Oryza sativa subsp. japonica TaxID=39947 RepID=A0A0P0WBA8_ORYSJ|nr:Os04g0470851 [Oryza sativa Japonica Group]
MTGGKELGGDGCGSVRHPSPFSLLASFLPPRAPWLAGKHAREREERWPAAIREKGGGRRACARERWPAATKSTKAPVEARRRLASFPHR